MAESKLVRGAAVLAAAAVISKLLGTLQKIPLQNIAGDEVFGIYNAVHPFYTFILLLATAGIPVAVSKFVSECEEQEQSNLARRLAWMASGLLSFTGILCFLFFYFGADWIAYWIGSADVSLAIRSVSFALLFVPLMGVLRGYFQGMQRMGPTAVSQIIEQIVRVATMLALILWFTAAGYSNALVAAGATFGSVTGAAAGLALMLWYWVRSNPRKNKLSHKVYIESAASRMQERKWLKHMILYALPVCFGSIVVPLLTAVDSVTLPRLLQTGGAEGAFARFGIYARGLPLVQLVSMLFSSVAVALVPAISEAKAKGRTADIRRQSELSLRITWWIGAAAMLGLMLTVKPINYMFYTNTEGSAAMAILSVSILFSAVQIVSTNLLQGLGLAKLPALYLFLAAVLKLILNVLLVPRWGIEGAAAAAVITFLIAAALNIRAIVKYTGVRFSWRNYGLKPAVALGIMGAVLWFLLFILPQGLALFSLQTRLEQTIIALVAVLIGTAVYVLSALRLGVISEQEWGLLPQLHRRLQRFFPWISG